MNRRDFCICSLGAVSLGAFMHNRSGFALEPRTDTQSRLPPIRAITRGPRFHWRGYYDKDLFDPSDRYVLANEIDFEGRTPDANDVLRVGMIDLQNNDAWTELGTTTAWNWQQGCMLQWLPGDKPSVLWNDRQDGHFVSKIVNVADRAVKILPMPIYCDSPDGLWGLSVDFRRLNDWILNDTYPDKGREQHPYLFQVSTGRRVPLAHLLSPAKYQGEFRCDNHPSASRDGKSVVVDSTHGGNGWQVYLIDFSRVVAQQG